MYLVRRLKQLSVLSVPCIVSPSSDLLIVIFQELLFIPPNCYCIISDARILYFIDFTPDECLLNCHVSYTFVYRSFE